MPFTCNIQLNNGVLSHSDKVIFKSYVPISFDQFNNEKVEFARITFNDHPALLKTPCPCYLSSLNKEIKNGDEINSNTIIGTFSANGEDIPYDKPYAEIVSLSEKLPSSIMREFNDDEHLVEIIEPKTGFMFKSNDIVKFPFFIIWILVASIIGIASHESFFLFSFLPFIAIIYGVFDIGKIIWERYKKTIDCEYIITNKRVIFNYKHYKNEYIYFNELDEINYENKGNDTGYITLGKTEKLFAGRGINMADDKYVLDNLTNYSYTSSIIKRLHSENKKSP